MSNDLHAQLVDTRDLVEGMRALAVGSGDEKLVYLTGTQMDRLLLCITAGLEGCIETIEDAADRAAMRQRQQDQQPEPPASDVREN